MANHKPRVDFLRKPLLSFTQFSSSARKIEKRTALQIGRWTGTDCVREARRGAVPRRAERNARPERRDDLIAFFSLPTPPSNLSATRVCVCPAVTFLRNAHDRLGDISNILIHFDDFRHWYPRGLLWLAARKSGQKHMEDGIGPIDE